ncbi:MAG: Abi family protein [Paludibacteraceae bacterium]|nr:Abi family protein [Paludibacteraceae bacterium]
MKTNYYQKPQISVEDQITLLKSQGLIFMDEEKANHLLQNISLFRFKSYLKPFRLQNSKTFKPNSIFEAAYSLYKFDSELRKMICSELEKIEVSIRAQLSLTISQNAGIFWFTDSSNFKLKLLHNNLLTTLKSELNRSDEETIVDFRTKYTNDFPPSWMTFEISSFGTLSKLYSWLNSGLSRRQVASYYGLSDTVMISWLHSLVYIRNICAHHGRLWNKQMSINPIVPRKLKLPFVSIPKETKKLYYILSTILYFLQTVNPKNTFVSRFTQFIDKYPQVDLNAMGFPKDWQQEPLWIP